MRRLYYTRHSFVIRKPYPIESKGSEILSNYSGRNRARPYKTHITAAEHHHSFRGSNNNMSKQASSAAKSSFLPKILDKQNSNEEQKLKTAASNSQRMSRRRTASSGRDPSAANTRMLNRENSNRPSMTTKVITLDFSSVHTECGAARYKVHKPGCHCPKVKKIRSSLVHPVQQYNVEQLDGLLVVPDIKFINAVYLCLGTTSNEYARDPIAAEQRLKEEIFGQPFTTNFKVSCATCLLQDEPNGFVCISSSSRQTVDFVRNVARNRSEEKRQQDLLHADHAHYLCTMPRRLLWTLEDKAKTRQQKRQATNELLKYMDTQGIPTTDSNVSIELEHHLSSVLHITNRDSNVDSAYWLILVYDDTTKDKNPCWTVNIPGGKRFLSEQSFQGAIRETEEEMSLLISEQWLLEDEPRRSSRKDERINAYYMIGPPSNMLMESVADDPFWRKEEGNDSGD